MKISGQTQTNVITGIGLLLGCGVVALIVTYTNVMTYLHLLGATMTGNTNKEIRCYENNQVIYESRDASINTFRGSFVIYDHVSKTTTTITGNCLIK